MGLKITLDEEHVNFQNSFLVWEQRPQHKHIKWLGFWGVVSKEHNYMWDVGDFFHMDMVFSVLVSVLFQAHRGCKLKDLEQIWGI